MRIAAIIVALFLPLAGCGGGGGGNGAPTTQTPPPANAQSPGGAWFVLDSNSKPVLLYISEAGDVRSIFDVAAVTAGPTFGAGSIDITGTDSINGVLLASGILPFPGGSAPVDLSCTLSGTVRERASLTVHIVCSDNSAIVYDENFTMTPQPGYDTGSSLDAIAGNYTLMFSPATNMLNIVADGTLFGMYDNGANCMVNGVVSIIDANYSFFDVEWTMTSCTDPIGIYEGAVMTGFAMQSPSPSLPQGSYYFILTGQSAQGQFTISVLYEPT